MDTEIRISTESRPWRRKFTRRSSRDSNPRPFNHESGALTTELFPPPQYDGVCVQSDSVQACVWLAGVVCVWLDSFCECGWLEL